MSWSRRWRFGGRTAFSAASTGIFRALRHAAKIEFADRRATRQSDFDVLGIRHCN
jgi:hypothetical protein